jgi:hypothetical protein
MELLGERFMWNFVSIFLETVLVLTFWTHPIILLGAEAQVEACLSPFGDSANLDVG